MPGFFLLLPLLIVSLHYFCTIQYFFRVKHILKVFFLCEGIVLSSFDLLITGNYPMIAECTHSRWDKTSQIFNVSVLSFGQRLGIEKLYIYIYVHITSIWLKIHLSSQYQKVFRIKLMVHSKIRRHAFCVTRHFSASGH